MFKVKSKFNLKDSTSSLIIGLFENTDKLPEKIKQLDNNFDGQISELINSGQVNLKAKEITQIFTFGKIAAKQLIIVGLGNRENYCNDLLREIFGKTFKNVKKANLNNVAVYLDSFTTDEMGTVEVAQLMSESMKLATYELVTYKEKCKESTQKVISEVVVYSENEVEESILSSLQMGFIFGKAVNSARSLVNLPGNMLTATEMANYAEQLANKYNFEIEILGRQEMEELGMGALLAVNNGSFEPPQMIVLKHQGKQDWTDVIGLVGKGITFDTGGYSLKPKDGIVGMKSDMGGAAAVLGAMEIIGELQLKQNVIAVIPATDNMIDGKALKPDDVIVSLSGKTIEVLNTDAEGRLVLADAVTYALQQGADYLVDVATLTGGVIVALGTEITGALTNNDNLYNQVEQASKNTGELIWKLPLTEKDKKRVRSSKIADLNNSPGREGHAIMGGAFIGEFAENTPWVHLDIAGTATTNKANELGVSGATGVMTRTLALLVKQFKPF